MHKFMYRPEIHKECATCKDAKFGIMAEVNINGAYSFFPFTSDDDREQHIFDIGQQPACVREFKRI